MSQWPRTFTSGLFGHYPMRMAANFMLQAGQTVAEAVQASHRRVTGHVFCPECGIDVFTNPDAVCTGMSATIAVNGALGISSSGQIVGLVTDRQYEISCDCRCLMTITDAQINAVTEPLPILYGGRGGVVTTGMS